MDRAFVFFGVGRAHQEVAGRICAPDSGRRGSHDCSGTTVEYIHGQSRMAAQTLQKTSKVTAMKLEPFAMERMQSTYENQVDVQPLRERRAPAARSASWSTTTTSREALLGRGAPLHADERHDPAARQPSRRSIRRDARSRPGHQRRLGSQLHHDVEPGRAGRRGRDDGAELHADVGAGARVRRDGQGMAAGHAEARPRWRIDADALERLVTAAHEADRHLQSEQPDRRPDRRRRSRSDRRDRRPRTAAGSSPTRSIAAPSATAARRRRSGAGPIGRIVTSGLSKAYGLPGLRIGWIVGAAGAHRVAVVVSRLHDDRARRAQRRAGAARAGAGAACAHSRAHARAS